MSDLSEVTIILLSLVGAAVFIGLPIYTYTDLIRMKRKSAYFNHTLWLILIFTVPIIGFIVYWLQGRTQLVRERRKFAPDFSKVQKP